MWKVMQPRIAGIDGFFPSEGGVSIVAANVHHTP